MPHGSTYLIQPIDVSIGKTFKDLLRKKFIDWFDKNHNNLTDAGNVKNPTHIEIARWIQSSENEFNETVIKNSFIVTGLNDNLNGPDCNNISTNLNKNCDAIIEIIRQI